MVLAIEPMVNAGSSAVRTLGNGWTVTTVDGGCSAHFEHTIAISSDGCEVLTGGG
jgi:methionyl aminopeptidase